MAAERRGDVVIAGIGEARARDLRGARDDFLEVLRSRPAAVVHDHHDDGQAMPGHGIELRHGEAECAIAHHTQHAAARIGSLGAQRKPHPEADRPEKSMSDIAAWTALPDHFVEPVVRFRSVGYDRRVGVDAVYEGGYCLIGVDRGRRACGLAYLHLQASALQGTDPVAPETVIRPRLF